ncbi:MAG: S9 family peptidase, partial [Thermoguttaceae bacterium]|nr:S9 family peptidase [Thermoguttaceae bacterium]
GARVEVVKTLEENVALREKLAGENFGPSEFFRVEIDSAFDFEKKENAVGDEKISIDGWVIFPPDWNPNDDKRYPLLVYVYGEPAAQTVVDSWGGSTYLYHRAIAERGCVVVSFDVRGTPAPKGREWRKSVYQKFGAVGRSDQAAALRAFLATQTGAKIDASRIGVWGWRGGGTSTLNLMFNYPELYQYGISVAPVPDYRNYDTIYQERYSGLITETPESYELGSPIHYAGNLRGKLLIIHGSGDDNCHYQTTEQLINALIAAGKDFDAFAYPFRSHGIFEGAGTTLHLREKMMKFWERELIGR